MMHVCSEKKTACVYFGKYRLTRSLIATAVGSSKSHEHVAKALERALTNS